MKKFIYCFGLAVLLLLKNNYIVSAASNPPAASADSVVLMDAKTGTILYSKNPDAAYPPASTTKTMTALLTLENTNLTDQVTIGRNPPFEEGSAVGIKEGEILTVKDLLYGLMLESGNDCAAALAEHIAGSKEKFAAMMNERAKELGATNTNFVNPSGLYDANHKTSARDLALIMRELVKFNEYKTIAMSPFYKIQPTNKTAEERYVNNKNRLVLKSNASYYKDAIGGKTGYTIESKHSYVAAAERNGQTLIAALVHDSVKTYFDDTINLFEYGFNNFELKQLFSKGQQLSTFNIDDQTSIPLVASEDFYYACEKNSTDTPSVSVTQPKISNRSLSRGETVTEASIMYKDTNLAKVELSSGIDYEYKVPVAAVVATTVNYIPIILKYTLYSVGIILALIVFFLLITKKRRRRLKRKRFYEAKHSRKYRDF
jgi:D-alanyl-D-alanine carboxypeptidase (penicillin-binding protein 5/6)